MLMYFLSNNSTTTATHLYFKNISVQESLCYKTHLSIFRQLIYGIHLELFSTMRCQLCVALKTSLQNETQVCHIYIFPTNVHLLDP